MDCIDPYWCGSCITRIHIKSSDRGQWTYHLHMKVGHGWSQQPVQGDMSTWPSEISLLFYSYYSNDELQPRHRFPALLQTSLRLTERQLETFHAGCLSYCVLTHLENCEKGTGSIIPSILAPSHGHTQHYNSPTLSSSPETSQKAEKKNTIVSEIWLIWHRMMDYTYINIYY